jgi:hypothetical protein
MLERTLPTGDRLVGTPVSAVTAGVAAVASAFLVAAAFAVTYLCALPSGDETGGRAVQVAHLGGGATPPASRWVFCSLRSSQCVSCAL